MSSKVSLDPLAIVNGRFLVSMRLTQNRPNKDANEGSTPFCVSPHLFRPENRYDFKMGQSSQSCQRHIDIERCW